MFVKFNSQVINADTIDCVLYDDLIDRGLVHVHFKSGEMETVKGPEAYNLIMELCPVALEGEGGKYQRHAWSVHNIIGHPLMQICAWLGCTRLGLKIHDITVPNPINK